MRPFDKDLELIDKIPGVNRQSAGQILAEIDTDMSRSFPRTISFYGLGWLVKSKLLCKFPFDRQHGPDDLTYGR
jgi:hypothetical protein